MNGRKLIHYIALKAKDNFLSAAFDGLNASQKTSLLAEKNHFNGMTPLHLAAQREDSAAAINIMLEDFQPNKIIELLLQNAEGKTPIFLAAKHGGQKAVDGVLQGIVGKGKEINEQSLREAVKFHSDGGQVRDFYRDAKSGLGEKIRKRRIDGMINALCGTKRELGNESISEMKARQNALGNAIHGSRLDKIKSYIGR